MSNNTFTFTPAHATDSFLRMALTGVSGSGKTWSALAIATGLADGGKIAVIDTEHGSASKYRRSFQFDVLNLEQHDPRYYIQAIEAAHNAGYKVLIVDSLSHAWAGRGGALELADNEAAKSKSNNTYFAWRNVTPLQNQLIDAIIRTPIHIIATMRSKSEYVVETGKDGKTAPRKVGMAPVQGKDIEYEFDIVGDMDQEHNMIISKSRCPELADHIIKNPTAGLGETLASWLSDEVVEVPPAPDPRDVAEMAALRKDIIHQAKAAWGGDFKRELEMEIGQPTFDGITIDGLKAISVRLDKILRTAPETTTAQEMGDDGSVPAKVVCDKDKYQSKFFAIAKGTGYAEDAGRASFMRDFTGGKTGSLSEFLADATTPEAQKLCTDLQLRISADKQEFDDSDPFADESDSKDRTKTNGHFHAVMENLDPDQAYELSGSMGEYAPGSGMDK